MSLTDNLVAYWKLDESSGQRNDSHHTNHLTDQGSTPGVAGKINNGADFESTSSQTLWCSDTTDLSFGDNDFTITLWFNPESQPTAGFARSILAKWGASGDFEILLQHKDNTNNLVIYISADGTTYSNKPSTFTFSLSTWYFIAVRYDSVNDLYSYRLNDGDEFDSVVHANGVINANGRWSIGSDYNGSGFWEYIDGIVDEVGVWKRYLSNTELDQLYNGGNGYSYDLFSASPPFFQAIVIT